MADCEKSGEDCICVRYGYGIAVFWRFWGRSCGVGWFWWDRREKVVICEILGAECGVLGIGENLEELGEWVGEKETGTDRKVRFVPIVEVR